ncbi:hypothetical protein F5Y17DRAFT_116338 [Xylariaceae sp. FL0594]|nr:hypothetical protein F5Y17DRAFT_116338 [Xylariaceae sp. FL0594]
MAPERSLKSAARPLSRLSSPEPEVQRGRKRRRNDLEVRGSKSVTKSGESATLRGRCRYRSISRVKNMSSLSRPPSRDMLVMQSDHRNRSNSPSPSRRKLLRIMQLFAADRRDRSRSWSTSPSFAPNSNGAMAHNTPKRRRQRTCSWARPHRPDVSVNFGGVSCGDDVAIPELHTTTHTRNIYAMPGEVTEKYHQWGWQAAD